VKDDQSLPDAADFLGMLRFEGRTNGRHASRLRNSPGRSESCRASEAMSNEEHRNGESLTQRACGSNDVVYIVSERRTVELALALAQSRKVESKGCDSLLRESRGDVS
jgi:hypothetical protein